MTATLKASRPVRSPQQQKGSEGRGALRTKDQMVPKIELNMQFEIISKTETLNIAP